MIVEALLVVSVTAFHFPVMPGRPGSDRLVLDMEAAAQHIQWMDSIGLLRVGKLTAVIRLDDVRRVTKVNNRSLHKIHGTVAAVFPVRIDKPLSACFFYHGVLVKFLTICTHITHRWHIFYVHLPLFAQFRGRIIMPQVLGFLLCRRGFFAVSQFDEDPVQGTGMPGISFFLDGVLSRVMRKFNESGRNPFL